jgi:hypothetical protein
MKVTRLIMFAGLGLAVATAGAAQLGRNTAPVTVRNTVAGSDIGPATGLQLSLVTPVQIFPETFAVSGLRINLIFGRNRALRGLDLGIVNEITERVEGMQLAVASNLAGDLAGLQIGLFNSAATSEAGCCQLGAINILRGEDSQGVMLGVLFNQADNLRGFQFGLINICNTLDGCQLGLINIISQSEALMFCPFFNAQF